MYKGQCLYAMDSWTWLVLFLQLASIESYNVQQQQQQPSEAAQLLIPGKGHVQWLPHRLRPPLQEIHSILTTIRRNKRNEDQNGGAHHEMQHSGNTSATGHDHLNSTETDQQQRKNLISDKEIVVIVVCSSIGLVICLLGTAISAKFYWRKVHGDPSGQYQGVLQKDTSDDQMIQSHKDLDGRVSGHQMFAQIDEMDEEGGSCPSTPTTKDNNKILQNGGDVKIINNENTPTHTSTPTLALNQLNGKIEPPEVITTTVEVEVQPSDGLSIDEAKEEEVVVDAEEEEEVERVYCRTGLSQSDCSLSSFTSVNPSYKYGNQTEYLGGYYGCCNNNCNHDEQLLPLLPNDNQHIPIPKLEEVEAEVIETKPLMIEDEQQNKSN
ncbi:hypothetical protein CHUAL_000681 [Chamberlinius hualienensis]